MSASSAFIVLISVAAFLAALTVFWLIDTVTGDHHLAATGTWLVLCLGWVVGRYGLFNTFFDIGIPALHFLRRYQPAATFPLFFAFQLLVWKALHLEGNRSRQLTSVLAGLAMAIMIFSYLYLWTGAIAWLTCILALWLCFRPAERGKALSIAITIGIITAGALSPYAYLLLHRATTLDQQQTLILTHKPDLLRTHEILGVLILLLLALGVRRGKIQWRRSRVLYVASIALLPFVVYNQQVLTGRAMQSFHYEVFLVNYSTMLGVTIALSLLWNQVSRRFLSLTAALSLAWGLIVVAVPSRLVFLSSAIASDQRIPVLLRLKELSQQDGTLTELRVQGRASTLVFSPTIALIRILPTWTLQGTLLDIGGVDFGAATREQRKEYFYMHLYYSKVESEALRKALYNKVNDPTMDSYARSVVFGHERITPALNYQFDPIRPDEIESEIQTYQAYINSFSREEALKRPLRYAVIPADGSFDSSNLDRWYDRNAGERIGDYFLYTLKLRP